MLHDFAIRFLQFKVLGQVERQCGDIGKNCWALAQDKIESIRVQGYDQVYFFPFIALAQEFHHAFAVFRTQIASQVQMLMELVTDGYPTGLQCKRKTVIGFLECRYVGFESIQDQHLFILQEILRSRLGMCGACTGQVRKQDDEK